MDQRRGNHRDRVRLIQPSRLAAPVVVWSTSQRLSPPGVRRLGSPVPCPVRTAWSIFPKEALRLAPPLRIRRITSDQPLEHLRRGSPAHQSIFDTSLFKKELAQWQVEERKVVQIVWVVGVLSDDSLEDGDTAGQRLTSRLAIGHRLQGPADPKVH